MDKKLFVFRLSCIITGILLFLFSYFVDGSWRLYTEGAYIPSRYEYLAPYCIIISHLFILLPVWSYLDRIIFGMKVNTTNEIDKTDKE